MEFSIIRGSIPPRTTYATPNKGGMSQLVHTIGSAAAAAVAASDDDEKNEAGVCGIFMGRKSY
jgi:hypothetical protein